MKYEYPITANYIRDWKPIHALREFGANALDAEVQYNAKATITYDAKKKVLLFKNEGVTLSRDTLLLGGTDKADRADTVGTYGEGMKMGFLVMAREGFSIVVRNGTAERWVPRMEFSEKWGGVILQLDVTSAKRQVETFEIEVGGVGLELWQALQDQFLKLKPADMAIKLSAGDVLIDAEMVGRVYCHGVFVTYKTDFAYGYNLNKMELNRDRKFTEEVDGHIGQLWNELVNDRPDKVGEIYRMLDEGTPEGAAVKYHANSALGSALAAVFNEKHPGAYIARSTTEAAKFEHFGAHAVVVGACLFYVLCGHIPTIDQYLREHRNDVKRSYSLLDLDDSEQENFRRAMAVLRKIDVVGEEAADVTVVDFVEKSLRGLYLDGAVKISRKELRSFGTTTTTLIHEFAHKVGRDGEHSHVEQIQELLAKALDAI